MLKSALIALGLSSTLRYIRAQQNDRAQCSTDELSREDRSLDALEDEVPATMLLQSQLQISSRLQARRSTGFVPPKLLILIVSCHQHMSTWRQLVEWGETAHPNGTVMILTGRLNNSALLFNKTFFHDEKMKHLIVNASDDYDGLPERMLMAFYSILHLPEFDDITHILKLDDTTVLGTQPISKPDGIDGEKIELALSKRPGDYLAPEFAYRAYDCKIERGTPSMQWHFDKMDNSSYWYNREQPCNGVIVYGDGEFGYILSRRAMEIVVNAWPPQAMSGLYRRYVYEDMLIGETLRNNSIPLYPTHLQGMPSWSRNVCPCNPASPSEACDNFCANSNRRCCWSACGNYPGLCESVRDA